LGDYVKNKLGTILKKVVFAFGIIYGINIILNNVGIHIPINLFTLSIVSFLGVPGLLSIFFLLFIIN